MKSHTITGECSSCHMIFDLTAGMECPGCHNLGLVWATMLPATKSRELLSPYPHVLNYSGTACDEDCDACTWAKQELPDILELERTFKLEDPR